jgi:Na+/phosphate symporter
MLTIAGKDLFTSIFSTLEGMAGAARNAFNRHSRQDLEQLTTFHKGVAAAIADAIKQVQADLAKQSVEEREAGLKAQNVLTRLEFIAGKLGGLADPLEKKIKDGVLFSDKAVSQVNHLFDHQAGLLRSLLDILKTDNAMLKRFVAEEGQRLVQKCNDFATEHEARLIEGLCLPQAAPLFLAILDNMRTLAQQESAVAQILAEKG